MKNLGGISIDFVENETEEQTKIAIGIKLKGVSRKAVANGVLGLILRLTEEDPRFPEMLAKVMEAERRGEVEVGKVVDEEWKD